MKKFIAPSMEVKKFNRVSILTASESAPSTTNVETATAAVSGQVGEGNYVKITL